MSTPPGGSAPRVRATIRDVAALAGVGTKTVSRVINDEANVSPQTRERVQRAVTALNFKPNQGAGALRRGDRKTLTLGLLLDAVDNPFSAAINRAVETVAYGRDTAVLAASSDNDPHRERAMVDAFSRRRVDGMILNTITEDQGYLHVEREQGTPLMFVDRPPTGLLADAVITDNYEATIDATRRLIDHGHRTVAYLGTEPATPTTQGRQRGFAHAMVAAGLSEGLAAGRRPAL
jgi:LacI family transcriptional regulator